MPVIFECVVNVSEGRDDGVLAELAASAGPALLDLHRDPDHNRAVLTLAGPADAVVPAARALATTAVARLDLRPTRAPTPASACSTSCPSSPTSPAGPHRDDLSAHAVVLRDEFARWLGAELGVPSFLYGPLPGGRTRTLPDIRRLAVAGRGLRRAIGPRLRAGAAGPADRGDRGGRPPGPGRLQRLGLLGRGGPPGGAPGAGAARAGPGPGRRATGPGVVQPDRPRPPRARPRSTTRSRPWSPRPAGRWRGRSWSASSPRPCSPSCPRARWAELGLAEESTVEARLGG